MRRYTIEAIVITSIVPVLIVASISNAYASGPRLDDERYEDGLDHPYDHERGSACNEYGRAYYNGFIDVCVSVEGNTEEICESATDRWKDIDTQDYFFDIHTDMDINDPCSPKPNFIYT